MFDNGNQVMKRVVWQATVSAYVFEPACQA
jgi:hypothetical protein